MEQNLQRWDAAEYRRNAAYVAELGSIILEWLAPEASERILDLGCGDGALTRTLAESCAEAVGVDASESMIRSARSLGIDGRLMDAHALDFEGEFDAVFSNAALHWMLEPRRVLQGVYRALKPEGRFVAEFGGFGNIAAIVTAMRAVLRQHEVDDSVPKFFPSPPLYQKMLEEERFRVERIELVPRLTRLPQGMEGWLTTLGGAMINRLPEPLREPARREVTELLRPTLCDSDGTWYADYVRLRVKAVKRS